MSVCPALTPAACLSTDALFAVALIGARARQIEAGHPEPQKQSGGWRDMGNGVKEMAITSMGDMISALKNNGGVI